MKARHEFIAAAKEEVDYKSHDSHEDYLRSVNQMTDLLYHSYLKTFVIARNARVLTIGVSDDLWAAMKVGKARRISR